MRSHLPRAFCLFILCLVAASLSSAQDAKNDKAPTTPNYYPLDVNNEWQYKVTANGRNSTIVTKIVKFEAINGAKLARLESPNVNMTEHLTQTDKGVFRNRFNGAEITPPFKLLPYPATPGAKWEGEFTVEKDPGKHKYSGELVKEEEIAVPFEKGKKFKAIRAVIKLEENGKMIETTYWFVQDVGFVKQSFETTGLSVLLELEKFEKKK